MPQDGHGSVTCGLQARCSFVRIAWPLFVYNTSKRTGYAFKKPAASRAREQDYLQQHSRSCLNFAILQSTSRLAPTKVQSKFNDAGTEVGVSIGNFFPLFLRNYALSMSKPLMRIPFTGPLPPPLIIPRTASSIHGAAQAIAEFLRASPSSHLQPTPSAHSDQAVLLTGAGISVASGLADYRGPNGTYRQNRSYRPVYYHEFLASHEWRKRYWARSYLGWTSLNKSKPNAAHFAVGELGAKGLVSKVITQNVDSFHGLAHPALPIVELHGYLRALVCTSCWQLMPRDEFQRWLSRLNPAWEEFLADLLKTGALDTENPEERRKLGYRTNPDGDADVPGAPYTTFRYPACPKCLKRPPILKDGSKARVEVDADGAWSERSDAGILKPNVIMFGESIPSEIKLAAEEAIDEAGKIMIIGSSLATYSAWRLVKRAHERGMSIGILNMGGTRKEEAWFPDHEKIQDGATAVRASLPAEELLPEVLKLV